MGFLLGLIIVVGLIMIATKVMRRPM